MTNELNRRRFLGTTAAAGAFSLVPRHVLGGQGRVAPNDKITVAHIGMGTQGFAELGALLEHPRIQIVAVCDPNRDSHDYVEWGKHSIRNRIRTYLGDSRWREGREGCPGGREVGRQVVDTYYARQRQAENFKACAAYTDFRELLAKENDLDAVKVMTPDHLHATVAIAAMKSGRHVLMHKPIANRLYEGRLVMRTVRETGRATHLLAYGSGAGNGAIVEAVQGGVIGKLREIHNWTNRPVWPQYTEIPRDRPAVPEGFEWDLWLGPAVDRPYHPHYTHTVFRGWYDFGGGSMADMGIYSLWPVFEGLGLSAPVSAAAWATHTCAIEDNVSRTVRNDFSYPTACALRFRFAAGEERPGMDLFWYDGGMKPRLPEALEARDVVMEREGILFVGDEGIILAGFHGQEPRMFKGGAGDPLWEKADGVGRSRPRRGGALDLWLGACQGGPASPGNFLNAAAITDAVNLGTVALRAGRKVVFNSEAMRITNVESANQYLRRECRPGWEL
jgi:predicted dehydrogenase